MMNDDCQLLRRYAESRCESAFSELVTRHLDLVYSAALRQVNGDRQLAQDVAQTVFADLARKAGGISARETIAGWLYQATRFAAAKAVRAERRRLAREKTAVAMHEPSAPPAWEQLGPVLDEAVSRLATADRDAVLLRFFQRKNLRAVGAALGASEEAARKRVERALDRLREELARRGVALSSGALAAVLTSSAVQAAPAALAGAVTTTACAGALAAAAHSTWNLFQFMSMTQWKAGILGAALVAGAGTTAVVQQNTAASLRSENEQLRQRTAQLEQFRASVPPSEIQSIDAAEQERLRKDAADVHRLRAEVARLRRQEEAAQRLAIENAQLHQQVRHLASAPAAAPAATPEKEAYQQMALNRLNQAKEWMLAFHLFAQNHDGMFPADLTQLAAAQPDLLARRGGLSPDQFEILYHGRLGDLSEPHRVIVLREKIAQLDAEGRPTRAYAFADGHSEIHRPLNGDFEKFERERTVRRAQAAPQPEGAGGNGYSAVETVRIAPPF